jgi:hypothetical protein
MKKQQLIIGGVVLGVVALYFYSKKREEKRLAELEELEGPTVSSVLDEIVASVGITGTSNATGSGSTRPPQRSTRASLVDCYTSNRGEYCCRDSRTGDIRCSQPSR